MKKTVLRMLSLLMALTMALTVGSIGASSATIDDLSDTGALNNYRLGYMSWGVKAMGLDVLQEKLEKSGKKLPEVIVAVLDTGLNTANRYLKGRYIDGYNFINNTSDYSDAQYHGTEVCGVIADGTSSNVKVMPLKVMDEKGDGKMSDSARAIYYALDHGADVINLSLSGDDKNHTYHSLDDAIAEAVSRGVVVIVAAGNQDCDASLRYPANKDNVITVTSVNKNNTLGLLANYGSVIDFALPGMNILMPHKSGLTSAFIDSGTSFAAPHAAAAAALLKTWDKSLNQEEIYKIFKQHAVDIGDKGRDDTYGWGMLDFSDFDIKSTYVRPTEPPTEPPIPTEAPTEPPVPTEAPTEAPIPTEAPTEPPVPTEAPTEAPIPTEAVSYVLGDVDGNGKVNSFDVTYLMRALAMIETPFSEQELLRGDVDRNGLLNASDVAMIQKYMVQMTVPYPIGETVTN